MKTYYATKPFYWDGKNIKVNGAVSLNEQDAKWMLARGAVTATKPEKTKTKK